MNYMVAITQGWHTRENGLNAKNGEKLGETKKRGELSPIGHGEKNGETFRQNGKSG